MRRNCRRGRSGQARLIALALVIVVAVMLIAVIVSRPRPSPAPPDVASATLPAPSDLAFLPDPVRTPGATLPVTARDICVSGYTKKVRNVPAALKRHVYQSYGIARYRPGEYEVDHLISLELGGSNAERNLWPQPYGTRPWNARIKDRLENELHRRVCDGEIDLASAQRAIAGNWVAAYRHYVDSAPPAPKRGRR
jgi:hypothetical protein